MPEAARSTTTKPEAGASLAGSAFFHNSLEIDASIDDFNECISAVEALEYLIAPLLEEAGVRDGLLVGIRRLFVNVTEAMRGQARTWRDMASFVPEPPREVRAVDPYAQGSNNRPIWKIAPEASTAARMLADAGEERMPVPIDLFPTVSKALDKASVRRAMPSGRLAGLILIEWLHDNGLLDIPAVEDAELTGEAPVDDASAERPSERPARPAQRLHQGAHGRWHRRRHDGPGAQSQARHRRTRDRQVARRPAAARVKRPRTRAETTRALPIGSVLF